MGRLYGHPNDPKSLGTQAGLKSEGPTRLGLGVGDCDGQAEGMEVGRAEGSTVGACGRVGNEGEPSSNGQPIANLSEQHRWRSVELVGKR